MEEVPTSYKMAVNKLLEKVEKSHDVQTKRQLFEEFTQKYTAIPAIIFKWAEIERMHIPYDSESHKTVLLKVFEHLHYDLSKVPEDYDTIFWQKRKDNQNKTLCYQAIIEDDGMMTQSLKTYVKILQEYEVFVPNRILNKRWAYYRQYSTKFISKSLFNDFENALILFDELKKLENDEEWLNCLKKSNSDEVIVQNIECRIGNDPFNKNLWNLYFDYLDEKNSKEILDVYSRYCRLFVDDTEKRVNYFKEIKKFQEHGDNVSKWVVDLVKTENDFFSSKTAISMMNQFDEKFLITLPETHDVMQFSVIFNLFKKFITQESKTTPDNGKVTRLQKIDLKFTANNCQNQSFSLPYELIKYVTKNADYDLLHILYNLSKRFFIILKVPLCHRLQISNWTAIYQGSLFIKTSVRLCEAIYVGYSLYVRDSNNTMTLSNIVLKIYKSDIRFMDVYFQNLTANEFYIFAGNGKLERLLYHYGKIIKEPQGWMPLEEIIETSPQLSKLSIVPRFGDSSPFYESTNSSLSTLKRKLPFEYFELSEISNSFDCLLFTDFIRKNAAPVSQFKLCYNANTANKTKQCAKYFFQKLQLELNENLLNVDLSDCFQMQ